jgi:hypothetical protein
VYITAHMPDSGENEADDGRRFPSDLSKSSATKKTSDGFTLDPAQFHQYFAAGLSAEQAAFMVQSQVLHFADNFKAVITAPAWRSKPSRASVATNDRTIRRRAAEAINDHLRCNDAEAHGENDCNRRHGVGDGCTQEVDV